ncbi:cyclic nucleotide-binding domain protein [Leptospira broomii serovar Hurstbridge str. 5399]|uniref:Cyclic nucleotide-binding domain protein n=1 Tax=Leptospira broomii serovar Hurstbridge str. 5399 TaxID=1049789 RepID=T0GLP3_9LEPT|nr:Crp/Fnr family transcriptional regulator [Leptospira broomii]EQA46288.1 cyclic nucleotide-binding domain protein [Leptospira broomii serovar Hurstbridge str. 5399]
MQPLTEIKSLSPNHWKTIRQEYPAQLESLEIKRKYKKGELIFSEKDLYRGFFTVSSGIFKVYCLNSDGREAILRIFAAGEVIAAHPIFYMTETCNYPAFCEALQDGELLYYPKDEFTSFLLQNTRALFLFSALTVEHLNYFRKKMMENLFLSVKDRILSFLRESGAEDEYVSLPITKQQLALLLGTTPESISRAFRSLLEDCLLEEKGDSYRVKRIILSQN